MLFPRPASGEYAPALLSLALLAGLATQVFLPAATEFPAVTPRVARPTASPVGAAIPDYAAVLAAPIFSPDRRPGDAVGGDAVEEQRPILIGVASDRRSGSAVIRGADGAVHVLRPGSTWRGWKLVGVGATSAALEGPAGRFTVTVGDVRTSSSAPSGGPSAPQDTNP
uniref:Type II secretion system protein GspC N-terminal domain-containing protein n=1 Tax=Caulobacter sp. (strain K31) TaxID=366602 RepID=B0T7N7_CAUSK